MLKVQGAMSLGNCQHHPARQRHGWLVIACHILSRSARRRLMATAALPRSTVGQADASGCPWTIDQARNRSHVTRLICHQLKLRWRGWFVWNRRVSWRHLSPTSHQHCACVGTLTTTWHGACRTLFDAAQVEPAGEHVPMLAYRDHTHTGRARDYGRIKHALAVIKQLLGCHKQPLDRCAFTAGIAP